MAFLLFWLVSFQVFPAHVVSMGVGQVKDEFITSRQAQAQNLLEVALYDAKPSADKLKLLSLDSKNFSKAVYSTLQEWVVALEAQNFSLVEIGPIEVQEAEKKALQVLNKSAAWKELKLTEQELREALRKKLQAKKLIEFRSQSSVLPVTDVEAQRYFEENRLKFGNLPFENFKENIKSYLSKAQVDKRLKDWFEVLMSKYKVKNLIAET